MNKIDEIIYKKFEKNQKIIHKNQIIPKQSKENVCEILGVNKRNNSKKKSNKKKAKKRNSKMGIDIKKQNTYISDKNEKINSHLSLSKLEKSVANLQNENNYDNPEEENDYELNTLDYVDALKYDKRTCCDYYMYLIKNKQLFAFTFCSFNDYNSGIIKKFIFFLSFALHFTINALFFNDTNMHQIYKDEGKYNFSYQFPKILISAFSSTIILRIMLETLVLTDRSILQVKNQLTYDLAINMKEKVLKCINIKFIIFFILNFILLVIFWFYLTCFSAKYENTQVYLIENTAISFGFSLFYPFIINIFPAVLRSNSLNEKEKNKSCLYSTSQIMQLLFI